MALSSVKFSPDGQVIASTCACTSLHLFPQPTLDFLLTASDHPCSCRQDAEDMGCGIWCSYTNNTRSQRGPFRFSVVERWSSYCHSIRRYDCRYLGGGDGKKVSEL